MDPKQIKTTAIPFVKADLESIPVGSTRSIAGYACTRWSDDVFEWKTWGKVEKTPPDLTAGEFNRGE